MAKSATTIGRAKNCVQSWSKMSSDCLSVSSTILPSTRPMMSGAGEKP